jgi:hypothetical protein
MRIILIALFAIAAGALPGATPASAAAVCGDTIHKAAAAASMVSKAKCRTVRRCGYFGCSYDEVCEAPKGAPPPAAGPKPTKAAAQKVVQIISADETKVATYCAMFKLVEQAAQAEDQKKIQDIEKQTEAMGQKLGPEYVKLMASINNMDPVSKEGREITAVFEPLDKQCK